MQFCKHIYIARGSNEVLITDLQPGLNTITIYVSISKSEYQYYTAFVIVDSSSSSPTLDVFTINGQNVLPSGSSVSVPLDTTSVTVVATATDTNNTVLILGYDNLQLGSNTVTAGVSSDGGISYTNYRATVIVESPHVTTLSVFTINGQNVLPADSSITVPFGTTSVNVVATPTYSSAGLSVTCNSVNIYIARGSNEVLITDLQPGLNTITIYVSISKSEYQYYTATVIVPATCFKEGTKILTDKGYISIENLRKGDLVKTVKHEFKAIDMIGKSTINHNVCQDRIDNQLYKCSQSEYPEMIEDLIITGAHSILVSEFKSEEKEETEKILGNIYVTDDRYRLPACVDKRASVYEEAGVYTIYHLALENDNYYMNYGIYANGLLVETSSKRYLKELSGMELL